MSLFDGLQEISIEPPKKTLTQRLKEFIWGEDIDLCPSCASSHGSRHGICPVCGKWDIRDEEEIAMEMIGR